MSKEIPFKGKKYDMEVDDSPARYKSDKKFLVGRAKHEVAKKMAWKPSKKFDKKHADDLLKHEN